MPQADFSAQSTVPLRWHLAPLLRSAGFAHVNEGLSHLKLTCTLFF